MAWSHSHQVFPKGLGFVLKAAAQAKGNQARFREAGLIDFPGQLVKDWRSVFARLAPLSKDELRAQPGAFLAQATDIVYRGKTSGTRGQAFTYFAGQRWNQARVEARQRSLVRWGFDSETPMLNLASRLSPVRPQDLSLVGTIDEYFLETLRQCIEAQPMILRGYPSRLCEVAVALRHRSYGVAPVRAVIATGECLFESQRSLLQQTFNAPVINEYGSQESGISGLSCPEEGRLHLDGDRCFYEIVDGRLLTTDLHNLAMPMVRYSGGDILRLLPDPCPCGRPGPTALVLGREEEAIPVNGEQRWPGEFDLPPFPGILGYQVQIYPDHRRVWLQPESSVLNEADPKFQSRTEPLQAWLTDALGEQPTHLLLETFHSADLQNSLQGSDSKTWLGQVTGGGWSSWLSQPLPLGEAQDVAALLQQLVAPRLIASQGIPGQTLALTETLLASEPAQDPAVEAMKIRVLLWALGLLAGSDQAMGVDVHQEYRELLGRFQVWRDDVAHSLSSAMAFDLMAPLLTLETDLAERLWHPVQDLIQQDWPQGMQADVFTFHHYLAILDQAGWKAQHCSHPWLPALRPLPAMLLGDLSQLAPRLDFSHVALWAEMVHNRPGQFLDPVTSTNFDGTWKGLRQALLSQNRSAVAEYLLRCFDQAESPAEVAQCWLEKSYSSLVFDAEIDLEEWLNILCHQVGLLGGGPGSSKAVSNPMPWLPLLNVLAVKLMDAGESELAYACLFAAAPPNRYQSNFDFQTQPANGKQSVISWRREA